MLILQALALLAGAASIQLWTELPPLPVVSAGVPAAVVCAMAAQRWAPHWRLLAALALGLALAAFAAHQRLALPVPAAVADASLDLRGVVVGLPDVDERRVRFRFQVEAAVLGERSVQIPETLQLTAYGAQQLQPAPGEQWYLRAGIRSATGYANPGGFDYPRWLFQQGIDAVGTVREPARARRLSPARMNVDGVRQRVRAAIFRPGDLSHPEILNALAVGDRGPIQRSTWDVLLATGTNHLMAISGLHVGLAAAFGFLLGRCGWRLLPLALRSRLPRPIVAALVGLGLASAYAALAGFAIPTQRALIMLAVGLGLLTVRRRPMSGDALALALIGVILVDPLAPMAAGFWLSFSAVAAILWVVNGRLGSFGWFADGVRLQLAISLALVPLLLLLFGRISLAAPLANIVAVPWVSLLVVPPTLLGTLIMPLAPVAGEWGLRVGDFAFATLWPLLTWLASQPWSELQRPPPGVAVLAVAAIGILVLLAPRALPGKIGGCICLLPLLLAPVPRPPPGALWLDILDAGEGVAIVVRTATRTMLVDTGTSGRGGADGGSRVVLPFLRVSGIEKLDDLIVTRNHGDHAGGAETILAATPVTRVWHPDGEYPAAGGTSSPRSIESRSTQTRSTQSRSTQSGGTEPEVTVCREGLTWDRDGVKFSFVHPRVGDDERLAGADHACLLRIDTAGGSVLLAAGLGERAEWFLLTRDVELAADVLVVSPAGPQVAEFLAQVAPEWIVHTGGKPKPGRAAMWPAGSLRGIARTDCGGAVRIMIDVDAGVAAPRSWRQTRSRFWDRGCRNSDKSGTMPAGARAGPD